ncbi:MAG: hypothetical protein AABW99_03150 [archaeon]
MVDLNNLYKGNYKRYLILPAILLVVFFFLILVFPTVKQGIDLRGGTSIIVRNDTMMDSSLLEKRLLEKYEFSDLQINSVSSPTDYGLLVQYAQSDASASEVQQTIIETFSIKNERIQVNQIGASFGAKFYESGTTAMLAGAILVTLVIFLFFREIIPSLLVIGAAIFDVLGALALMALFGIPLSGSTIPALLAMVGYSIGTDIMLTTRVLKRKEKTPAERSSESMATGLTMTFTSIAALLVMAVLSYFMQIQVFFEISAVLLFGLFADIISTWLMNAPLLLWFVEKRGESK